ncbi:transposase [Nonomuraea sp. NPDC050153]|uniref:transposase n=1 Tax=Nonomuraea sp. NPDC050153 TaxID=3364359 RepID=UPI0037A9D98E
MREVSALEQLAAFRAEVYSVFGRWADALFEIVDALAGAGRPIRSVAELMFDRACRRGWGSLYQALESGEVIVEQARDVLARWVRPAGPAGVAMFAIDASKYPRPGTRYVPDVGMQYDAALDGGRPEYTRNGPRGVHG